MNEIEKMMQNAEIEPIAEYCKHQCNNEFDDNACIGCKHIEKVEYPPFTAEKQLELIKWLARKGLIQINYSSHQCYQFNSFRVGGDYKTDISEALASYCNSLWQDLIEEEKHQIKEILNE